MLHACLNGAEPSAWARLADNWVTDHILSNRKPGYFRPVLTSSQPLLPQLPGSKAHNTEGVGGMEGPFQNWTLRGICWAGRSCGQNRLPRGKAIKWLACMSLQHPGEMLTISKKQLESQVYQSVCFKRLFFTVQETD